MIKLTRLNGTQTWLSADLVASVEERPDTLVTLVDGNHLIVTESAQEVVAAITAYRASVLAVAEQVLFDLADDAEPDPLRTASDGGSSRAVVPLHRAGRRARPND